MKKTIGLMVLLGTLTGTPALWVNDAQAGSTSTHPSSSDASVSPQDEKLVKLVSLMELNNRSSALRESVMRYLEGSCGSKWCLGEGYGSSDIAEIRKNYDFKLSEIAGVVRVGSIDTDNCPKQDCAPQFSGEESWIVVMRVKFGFTWDSGVSDFVVRVSRQYSKETDESEPRYDSSKIRLESLTKPMPTR